MSSSASSGSLSSSSLDEESSFEEAAMKLVARRRKERKGTQTKKKRGGSHPGKRPNKNRNRVLYHELLMRDYFVANPIYDSKDFRRRFRMRRELFDRILNSVVEYDSYFKCGVDCCGVKSFSSHQKITCALRYMAYGGSADQ